MEPTAILKIGSESISLVSALAKLIKENHASQAKGSLSELLGRLQIDAVRISSELEMKLQILYEKLGDLGLDPDKTLESQLSDLAWYSWVRRARLKAYREEFHGAYRQLSSFVDDATALMLCEGGGVMGKTEMFAEAYKRKRELDAIVFSPGLSLGETLKQFLKIASKVNEELRAA